jgi:hypothetical protein
MSGWMAVSIPRGRLAVSQIGSALDAEALR